MPKTARSSPRDPGGGLTRAVFAAALGVLGIVGVAHGQLAQPRQGHAIDASNRVGSGGYNSALPQRAFNTANLFVTGNVAGGRRFQGFSPIRDPSSLLISLPTSSLSGFRGDTIGIQDVVGGRANYQINPFFDRSQTVAKVSAIARGLTLPGSSVPRSQYVLTNPPRGLTDYSNAYATSLGPAPPGTRVQPSTLPTGMATPTAGLRNPLDRVESGVDQALAESPLFGMPRLSGSWPYGEPEAWALQWALERQSAGRGAASQGWIDLLTGQLRPGDPAGLRPDVGTAVGRRVMGVRDRGDDKLLSRYDLAPGVFSDRTVRSMDQLAGGPDRSEETAPEIQPSTALLGVGAPLDRPTAEAGARGLFVYVPGGESVFEDFVAAVDWLSAFADEAERAEALGTLPPHAVESFTASAERARRMVGRALDSYAGTRESLVNRYITQAESYLRQEQFYRACGAYETAALLDHDNPLIGLGHGHALLFAGDYTGAVYYLTRAIDRFPGIAHFGIDLTAFIPDPTLLDVRRADLERRLVSREDPELRFLLGYAEYYSGLKKFGVANLRRAAQAAPEGSVIARFPAMLGIDRLTPPPAGTPDIAE